MSTWLRVNTSARPPEREEMLLSVFMSAVRLETSGCPVSLL